VNILDRLDELANSPGILLNGRVLVLPAELAALTAVARAAEEYEKADDGHYEASANNCSDDVLYEAANKADAAREALRAALKSLASLPSQGDV
jgi:hypothetical protein